jgi:tetratricopeptide (TPR) repeat protein
VARVAVSLLAIGVCLLLMREAARIGFSRLLTRYALTTSSLEAADQAVQLTPADPDAHRARALILNRFRRTAEAEASLEVATGLRAGHADLWIELANAREELGDNEGALAALNQAVRSAPYYAQTHWQRGNLLLRMNRYDEAFVDLREAAARNRKYFPTLIDLTWGLTANAEKSDAFLQLRDDNDRLEFARFLARKGRGVDVVDQIRLLSGPLSDENRNELMRLLSASRSPGEIVGVLIESRKVDEIINSSFEEPLSVNDSTPGWTISQARKPRLAVDVSEKLSGERSLQVTFDGEWDPGTPLLSQRIVVQAGVKYRLSFGVRTKDLVSGGAPRIVLTDGKNNQLLAKSDPFPSSSVTWLETKVEFTAASESVVISFARDNCASSPCPIFGTVWLDKFSLQKL